MDALTAPQMSVLDAIAHGEVVQPWDKNGQRSGYGETVSNQQFDPSNYSNTHPYQSGNFRYYQGRYGPSSASGRYQETLSTYLDNVRKYGISGFSPVAQDQRAFLKASDLYQNSGAWKNYPNATGDLTTDVTHFGSDPNWWSGAAAPALHHEWTSVPGGLEPNDHTRTWVSNAAFQFGHGTGGLPPEASSTPEYSAEDAPGLLSTTEAGVASKAQPPVPDVTYTQGILAGGGASGGGGGGGGGGGFGDTGILGGGDSNTAAVLQAMQANEPQFAQTHPLPPISMPRMPLGLAIARAAANRQMLGFPEYQQLGAMAYPGGGF